MRPLRLSPPARWPASRAAINRSASIRSRAVGRFEAVGHGVDHFAADEQVALHGVILALPRAGINAVFLAGEGGGASLHVDDAELSVLAVDVVFQQLFDRLGGRFAGGQ